jgi:putative Ca2+/H+ antiporter (TMEM165/GDT1 family)
VHWELFFSIFGIIFLAELPDKTALATLLLAAKSSSKPVFIGVSLAFLVQTIVAALFGNIISLAPVKWVHVGAGVLFLIFAIQLWRSKDEDDDEDTGASATTGFWKTVWKAFLVIFIAEWGDLTQLATASLIARYHENQVTVFFAAFLALVAVTAIAVFAGSRVHKLIKPALLKRICVVLFLAIGVCLILTEL